MSTEFQRFTTQFTEFLLDQIQGKEKLVLLDKALRSGKNSVLVLSQGWMEALLNRSRFDGTVSMVFLMKGKSLLCANKTKGLPLHFLLQGCSPLVFPPLNHISHSDRNKSFEE
jgi:hypothetical protein